MTTGTGVHPKEWAISRATTELNRLMHSHEISVTWLSDQSGVSKSQISNFKNGKLNRLAGENLVALIRALPPVARWEYIESVFLKEMDEPTGFHAFLKEWQSRESVSDYEFIVALQQRTPMSSESIRSILSGRRPDDTELGFLGTVIRQPNGEVYTYEELLKIRS